VPENSPRCEEHGYRKKISFSLVIAVMAFVAAAQVNAQILTGPNPENRWIEYLYHANSSSPGANPSTLLNNGTAVGFTFTSTPDVSMFLTKHPAYKGTLLGDQTGQTASATFTVSGSTGGFNYYGQPGDCTTPASVRLYFETNNSKLGYSQYWWSNPSSQVLTNGEDLKVTAFLDPSQWSDWDGHHGNSDPAHIAAFNAAVKDIRQVGLSFGGGCFFANGVGETNGSTVFALSNYTIQ
jgi:hypothetical protein